MFRAVAARADYLAADKADTQFSTKEACGGMLGIMDLCGVNERRARR